MAQSRSSADLQLDAAQASPLRRTASTRSLPGTAVAAKQRPQSVKPTDPSNDLKAQARHLKAAAAPGRTSSFREGEKRKVFSRAASSVRAAPIARFVSLAQTPVYTERPPTQS